MESNSSLFTISDEPLFIKIGVIYFIIAVGLLPLYAITMTAIYMKNRKNSNMTYKLMNIINFFEVGQSIGHLLAAPVLIFPNIGVSFNVAVRVIGCVINTFWIAEFPVMAILAVCRIFIFCNVIKTNKMPSIVKVLLFISIAWVSFVLLYGCITQNFAFYPPSWGYDFEVAHAETFANLELLLSFPCLAIIYSSYLTIIFLIYTRKKKRVSNVSRKDEISIMLQYTFVTTYMVILIILWHRGDLFLDMSNLIIQGVLNSAWIACSYMNPVLLLLLNH